MKRFPVILAAGLLFFAACSDQPADPGPSEGTLAREAAVLNSRVGDIDLKDRYIVVFKDAVGNTDEQIDQITRGNGSTVHYRYRYAIKGFCATIPAQALEGIRHNPNVAYIETDGIMNAITTQAPVPSWGIDRIDQSNLPVSNSYTYNFDGTGVTVYIIDTGIRYDHQEFGGRASFGYDAFGGTGADGNGHGTHVSGTVGGSTVGVAKNVALKAVRVLNNQGSGTTSGVIAGINWVISDNTTYAVANMSLGGSFSQSLNTAVANAVLDNVTFAVAAGNESTNAATKSPASEPTAITVGATTSTDGFAYYSNYGSIVDILAPGSSIYSSYKNSATSYSTLSGTSMASPHVAGVAALYLDEHPNSSPATIASAIVSGSTPNMISGVGSGAPNLLLNSLFAGGTPLPTTLVHVGAAAGTSAWVNSRNWTATLTVTVHDASHAPAAGVTVTVAWSGGASGSASAVTNSNGVAVINTSSINKNKSYVDMTVSNLSGSGFTYSSSANDVSFPIRVNKP